MAHAACRGVLRQRRAVRCARRAPLVQDRKAVHPRCCSHVARGKRLKNSVCVIFKRRPFEADSPVSFARSKRTTRNRVRSDALDWVKLQRLKVTTDTARQNGAGWLHMLNLVCHITFHLNLSSFHFLKYISFPLSHVGNPPHTQSPQTVNHGAFCAASRVRALLGCRTAPERCAASDNQSPLDSPRARPQPPSFGFRCRALTWRNASPPHNGVAACFRAAIPPLNRWPARAFSALFWVEPVRLSLLPLGFVCIGLLLTARDYLLTTWGTMMCEHKEIILQRVWHKIVPPQSGCFYMPERVR